VRAGDHRRALVQQVLNGGQGGADAFVVRDDAAAVFCHGDIKVAAQQHFFPGNVQVLDGLLVVIHIRTPPKSYILRRSRAGLNGLNRL
jgi:hypothetical protein